MPFACQDWPSGIKISQIPFLSHVFSGKKTFARDESKTQIEPIDASCEPKFDSHIVVW
jgi:hypothetical protein